MELNNKNGEYTDENDENDEESKELNNSLSESESSHFGQEKDSQSESENETQGMLDDKRQTVMELMKEEQKKIINRLSDTARIDAEKGRAVKHQMNIYEGILEARINIQKGLSSSMQLPLNKTASKKFQEQGTSKLLEQALVSSLEVLKSLSELRLKLMKNDEVIVGSEADSLSLSKKRTLSAAFENHNLLDDKLQSYRDKVLLKWSRRVQATSGSAALNSNKFKSLNQTSDIQVKTVLADMDRLVKRTRLNRSGIKILGRELDQDQNQDQALEDRNLSGRIDRQLNEDAQIFDDQDFYRILLKDLVDKRMADSAVTNGLKWKAAKSQTKKKVDMKASKGRKLRFHVQEKIQGFAAPRPTLTWTEEQIDELFSSLLGQHITINEESEQESSESEAEVEVENDGLKIFG